MTIQRSNYAIFRESDRKMIEGGFSTRAAAEAYVEREYNEPARREGSTEHYYVQRQPRA